MPLIKRAGQFRIAWVSDDVALPEIEWGDVRSHGCRWCQHRFCDGRLHRERGTEGRHLAKWLQQPAGGRGQAPPLRGLRCSVVGDGLVPSRARESPRRTEPSPLHSASRPWSTSSTSCPGARQARRGRACPVPCCGSPRRTETGGRAGTSPAPARPPMFRRRGRACPVPCTGSPRRTEPAGGRGQAPPLRGLRCSVVGDGLDPSRPYGRDQGCWVHSGTVNAVAVDR